MLHFTVKLIFYEKAVAEWVSGSYASHGRELRVIDGFKNTHEDRKCQSTSAKKRGGSNSPRQTADEYSNLLGLK